MDVITIIGILIFLLVFGLLGFSMLGDIMDNKKQARAGPCRPEDTECRLKACVRVGRFKCSTCHRYDCICHCLLYAGEELNRLSVLRQNATHYEPYDHDFDIYSEER